MGDKVTADTRSQHWLERIAAWQASGQSQKAFCAANELNYPRFGYWLRKFRQQGRVTPAAARRRSGFVRVVAPAESDLLTVRLSNGIEMRGVTAENLAVVEQLLKRL